MVRSKVRVEDIDAAGAVQAFRFEGDRLEEVVAMCGFARELQHDCWDAFRGAARPLPWDDGDFPDELVRQ
jgi:hypothetical protein